MLPATAQRHDAGCSGTSKQKRGATRSSNAHACTEDTITTRKARHQCQRRPCRSAEVPSRRGHIFKLRLQRQVPTRASLCAPVAPSRPAEGMLKSLILKCGRAAPRPLFVDPMLWEVRSYVMDGSPCAGCWTNVGMRKKKRQRALRPPPAARDPTQTIRQSSKPDTPTNSLARTGVWARRRTPLPNCGPNCWCKKGP